jgi:guanylate kinase
MRGQLFVISAPSGAGKSTIVSAVLKRLNGLAYSISHTTRKPRKTERDHVDYHFIGRNEFKRMIKEGAFAEWAMVYEDFYGTSHSSLKEQSKAGLDVLMDLDSQGAKSIKQSYQDVTLIFILPPSLALLEDRLRTRGTDNEDAIRKRLSRVSQELRNCLWYDFIVVNNDLEKAIEETQAIILSSRCKASRRAATVERLLQRGIVQTAPER